MVSFHRLNSHFLFIAYHIFILLLLLLFSGCGSRLTRERAADIVAKSDTFQEFRTERFMLGERVSADEQGYRALESADYITITKDQHGNVSIALTTKGQKAVDSPGWDFGPAGAWYMLKVPVAKPEIREVTGVLEEEKQSDITFTWGWALTEVGRELQAHGLDFSKLYIDPKQESQGAARLALYDDGWRATVVRTSLDE